MIMFQDVDVEDVLSVLTFVSYL